MGLWNKLSCEAGSFSHCHNPHRFFQSEVLRLYFPTLEPWFASSVSLPRCSSWLIHMQMWDYLLHQPLPCRESSPPQLPVSASSTSLDEYFFFNSLVIRLSHSLIFVSSSCFLFLNLFLLLVVQGGKVYVPMPPS